MRWSYANRESFYRQYGGNRNASRATVYAWHQSLNLAGLLDQHGLIRDGRDTTTGRKVATIIREMSRLVPADLRPYNDEEAEALVGAYKRLRMLPLAEVRRICRDADDAH